jgi:hypothetical protein
LLADEAPDRLCPAGRVKRLEIEQGHHINANKKELILVTGAGI